MPPSRPAPGPDALPRQRQNVNIRPSKAAANLRTRAAWDLPLVLVLAGYLTVWLAAGFFFQFQYLELLTSDPFITGLLLLGLVFAVWLAIRPRPWLYLTAGLTTIIVPVIVVFAFGAIDQAGAPLMGGEFAGTWVLILAIVLALPAGILGFVRGRKKAPAVPLRHAWRSGHAMFAVAAMVFVAGMGGAAAIAKQDLTANGVGNGYDFDVTEIGGVSTRLVMRDYDFVDPPAITAGVPTEIVIENQDSAFHTFTYTRGDVEYDHAVLGGATIKVLVLFDTPGTIVFRCVPHSGGYDDDPGESMVGALTVTEA